jgi:hypothetical protein
MKDKQSTNKLNRYTTLPVLLDLLRTREIVLLDPVKLWEDKNDVAVILEYAKRRAISKVFAICFANGDETVHHWKAYANGSSGCCIEFDRNKLLQSFPEEKGFRHDYVKYRRVECVETNGIETDDLPFSKRMPYQFENEFRILWEGDSNQKLMRIKIELSAIRKITLSPNMPQDIYRSMKQLLQQVIGNDALKINHSTLYRNARWIKALKRQA